MCFFVPKLYPSTLLVFTYNSPLLIIRIQCPFIANSSHSAPLLIFSLYFCLLYLIYSILVIKSDVLVKLD